jgi:hypothetical protein
MDLDYAREVLSRAMTEVPEPELTKAQTTFLGHEGLLGCALVESQRDVQTLKEVLVHTVVENHIAVRGTYASSLQ